MVFKEMLRALLDLIDDLQNAQLELRTTLINEQFNNLVRQAHNPQSGILGEPVDNLLKRVLHDRFKEAIIDVETRERNESLALIEVLINNVKMPADKTAIDLSEIVPLRGIAGEGIRLLSMILTSIFGNNRRRLERIAVAVQKASIEVNRELEGHFLFLDNLQLIDREYADELKSLEFQLTNIEHTLFNVSELLSSLFRKTTSDFFTDEAADINQRINHLVTFAEEKILNSEDRLRLIEAESKPLLLIINSYVLAVKSKLIHTWNDFSKNKAAFHEAFIGEIEQFKSPDEMRKKNFLDSILLNGGEVLDSLRLQIENLSGDLSRKAALITF